MPIMDHDIDKKKRKHFHKEQDYQRDCQLLLQQKNCKQGATHSAPIASGVQTPLKL